MYSEHGACCFLLLVGQLVVIVDGVITGGKIRGVPSCSSRISNFNMSASSFQDSLHSPHEARFNGPSAWCARQDDVTSPWIQLSFSENVHVTEMKIQGSITDFVWVKSFNLEYRSRDGRWTKYSKVLQGNSFHDYPSGKINTFHPALFAHDIRVYPLEVYGIITGKEETFAPCLRMEFYGCGVFCSDPGQPRHGIRNGNNFLDGMSVNFTCESSGYDLVGANSIRCMNGTWDKATPSCKARCPHPGTPRNGLAVNVDLRHAGITQYKCRQGYKLQGFANLTCSNGRWDRRLPSCIADDDDDDDNDGSGSGSKALCSDPGTPVNGGRHGDNFFEGQTVQFFCQKSFTLFGHTQITCINGSWSGIAPQCRVKCKDPGTPLNGGRHGNNFAEGQSVMFFCNQGYHLVGIDEPMCIAGQWSSGRPLCKLQVNKCKRPKSLPNIRIYGPKKEFYEKGERLFYLCAVGYFSYGTGVRTCQGNTWSNSHFRCAPKSCGDPGTPVNGYKDGLVYKIKSKVYYYCYPGHEMYGSSVRECLTNGSWTGNKPRCKPVGCGHLPTPLNGEKEVTVTTYLGRVKFRCTRRGYRLIGSSVRECQANGNWSGTQPQCKKKSCDSLNPPVNGVMSLHGNYSYRSSVVFTCNKNHVMQGNERTVCLDDGTWSSAVPKCKKISNCPLRWKKHNGSCYLFKHKTRISQSWNRLQERCKKYKASLLHLHDNREWNFVKRHLKSKVSAYAIGMYGQGGVWRWSGGGRVTLSKWDTSKNIVSKSKMCGTMQASSGLFGRVSCDQKLRAYICKKS